MAINEKLNISGNMEQHLKSVNEKMTKFEADLLITKSDLSNVSTNVKEIETGTQYMNITVEEI